jgi:integrase
MGRRKVEEEKKKVKLAVSLDPELPQYFKDKSIKAYCYVLSKVFHRIGMEFKAEDVENLFTQLNISPRTYNQYRTIINFYTTKYLNYSLAFTKAKVDKSLPTFVTREEFNKVILTIPNLKHRLGFCLMYGSGLRG